jgi:hypothetical protein
MHRYRRCDVMCNGSIQKWRGKCLQIRSNIGKEKRLLEGNGRSCKVGNASVFCCVKTIILLSFTEFKDS